MDEKKINIKTIGKNRFKITPKEKDLSERIKNKMKYYRMTNFNFILDKKINDLYDYNYNTINSIKEKNTYEDDKNTTEYSIIDKNRIQNGYTQIEKKYNFNSKSFDITLIKNNEIITKDKDKDNNNLKKKFEVITPYGYGNSKLVSKENEFNSKNYDIYNNYKLQGKKKQKNKDTKKEIIKSNNTNNQQLKILKLIQKYSYKYVFNSFLKCYVDNNISDEINNINDYSNKDYKLQIETIINDLGIEKILSFILSISNNKNKNNQIQKENNNKIFNVTNNIYKKDIIDNKDNLYSINSTGSLDSLDCITKDKNKTISLEEEDDYKKINNIFEEKNDINIEKIETFNKKNIDENGVDTNEELRKKLFDLLKSTFNVNPEI